MSKNLYEILEVDKNASIDEIKSAYKKLAMKYHPDRNGGSKESEDKFKEIVSAYEVLSDPQKKQNYDMFGSANGRPQQGGNPFDINMNDIFSQFGDIFGGFGSAFGNGPRTKRGGDLKIKVTLTLNEIIFGADKKIKYKRASKCSTCSGIGGEDTTICRTCNGTGQRVLIQQTPFGRIQQTAPCNDCGGDGKKIKNKCSNCNGDGTILQDETVDIKMPAGALNGMQMSMPGYGNNIRDGQPGDLYIVIEEIPDDKFKRDGINLLLDQWITISDAVLGTKLEVETPRGLVDIDIPAGCDSGRTFTIKGKGIPNLSSNGNIYGYGDLNIKVNVNIPKLLTREQREAFEKLRSL